MNPEELGLYVEGDIVSSNPKSRNGLTDEKARWPNGVVPYEIAGYFSEYTSTYSDHHDCYVMSNLDVGIG